MKVKNNTHNNALDGLRGYAIIIVLLSHLSDYHKIFHFTGIGKMGVFLFFVLSSYLLDYQIINFLKYKNENLYNLKFWINYFLRRFLRILPLYFLVLFINTFLEHFRIKHCVNIGGLTGLIEHFSMLKGNYHFWSIPVEFRYYLFSPLIIILLKLMKWNVLGTCLLFSVLYYLSNTYFVQFDNQVQFFINLTPFIVGSIMAYFISFYKSFLQKQMSMLIVIGSLGMILPFLLVPSYYDVGRIFFHKYILIVSTLFGFLLLSLISNKDNFLKVIFSNRIFMIFGRLSFSIYLIHINVIEFSNSTFGDNTLSIFISITFIMIISFFTYRFIELPLSKIRIKYEN